MNEYEIMIKNLENRVTELEKLTQCKETSTLGVRKWQPKAGDWCIYGTGEICEDGTSEESQKFGTERATQEEAKSAAVEMRRFNRLLALRDELCEGEVLDWENGEEKHYLYHWNGDAPKWKIGIDTYSRVETPYFTSYDLAQKACDMLNRGEVEL